ncbi:hypothetical protein Agub_g5749 [Astrephomene gubernaculifera]|uniref:Phosphoglycerate mutase-like protein n=1 Tax=Astrephomene gubernaculifera TaxID=47775 RepID=A0AAD3DMB2_9CHLO|nr:hypothetical protein Agub_g5749 [Astrephomene gubernaculifera]
MQHLRSPAHQIASRLRNTALRRTHVLVASQQRQQNGDTDGSFKVLHLMRHGVTEMNDYLAVNRYDAPDFVDPLKYDTVLTARGRASAQAAASVAERLSPPPELLLVSPLTRALQTAHLAFMPHYRGPVMVEPLARERVWHASDIGSSREQLQQAFPDGRFPLNTLPDVWWYCVKPEDPRAVGLEPEALFRARIAALRRLLAARPERSIALVAHWGVLHELTGGVEFANCEIRSFAMETRRAEVAAAGARQEGAGGSAEGGQKRCDGVTDCGDGGEGGEVEVMIRELRLEEQREQAAAVVG